MKILVYSSVRQCSRGQNTVNDDRITFDVRTIYRLYLPFQVYFFYLSTQLRWIAWLFGFLVGSENALLNFKLWFVCTRFFFIYLPNPLPLEFIKPVFTGFIRLSTQKIVCWPANTHLHKNTPYRKAALYLIQHHSILAAIYLQRTLTSTQNAFHKLFSPSESFILYSQLPQVTIFLSAV